MIDLKMQLTHNSKITLLDNLENNILKGLHTNLHIQRWGLWDLNVCTIFCKPKPESNTEILPLCYPKH